MKSAFLLTLFLGVALTADKSRDFGSCVDKFCPPGRYCIAITAARCLSGSCTPILACVEDSDNGCVGVECPSGQVCVERTVSCIGRSCRKTGKCVTPHTCEATVCPPSHKCTMDGGPKCVKAILNLGDVTAMEAEARTGH